MSDNSFKKFKLIFLIQKSRQSLEKILLKILLQFSKKLIRNLIKKKKKFC